jgi:hypothetical protein
MPNQPIESDNIPIHAKHRLFILFHLSLPLFPQQRFLLVEFEVLPQFPLADPVLVKFSSTALLAELWGTGGA